MKNKHVNIICISVYILSALFVSVVLTACPDPGHTGGEDSAAVPGDSKEPYRELYVRQSDGDDSGPGSADEPFLSIQAAIDYGSEHFDETDIYVAEGTYSSDFYSAGIPVIEMAEGVSLYGGYSEADWEARDTSAYATVIRDDSVSGGTLELTNRAVSFEDISDSVQFSGFHVYAGEGDINLGILLKRSSPVIENCHIYMGGGDTSAAVYCMDYSSPVIRRNVITGGNATASFGVYNYDNCSSVIYGNIISGSEAAAALSGSQSLGIYNDSYSAVTIYNNMVDGGNGEYSLGIYNDASSAVIRNNTIDGGHNANSYTIAVGSGTSESGDPLSEPVIENNIIFNSGGYLCYGYYDFDSSSPSSLRNNDFYNCYDSYTEDQNVSLDPLFADIDGADDDPLTMEDNDWHLSSSSPSTLVSGGLNGSRSSESWGFATDFEGSGRTASGTDDTIGWSMGAFEFEELVSGSVLLGEKSGPVVSVRETGTVQTISFEPVVIRIK